MNLAKCAFILLCVSALAITATAQSPSKVLKQAEKALGGRKALQSITSVAKRGTITRVADGAVGQYVLKTSKPNLFYERNTIGDREFEVAFNGRSSWSRAVLGAGDVGELWTHTGKVATDNAATSMFRNNLWLNAKAEKAKLTSGGQAQIDGKLTDLVLLITVKGAQIKMYFDAASGLLVRDETHAGDETDITDYGDYRTVEGVKQPFFVKLTSVGAMYEIRFDEILLNRSIPRTEFDFPRNSNEPLPDIAVLLQQLQSNEDNVEKMLDSYSFTQKTIMRELGKDGIFRETESETNQLSFYKGNRITRLIEKNGKPLNEKQQADADKDAAKQVEEIEKKLAKRESRTATGKPSEDSRRISIAEVLRASKLLNPRRERFRGRDCVVFDFEPNPAFDTKNATSILKFFGKTAGVIWVDEKDKQVARMEAALFESMSFGGGVLAKFKKGATFTLEKERVNNEIWLPSQADINASIRVLLVKGIDINQLQKFYDYQKFETEVKDAKVNDSAKP